MLKILNITTLVLFVCFLIAPTVSFAFNKDIDTYSLILNEEEESHSKTKSQNNNFSEEEEKEVQYHFFHNLKYLSTKITQANKNLNSLKHTIKDDLVFKIPLPPPEPQL